ncbi:MAG: RNA-protein complex protein Nop10 [Nanoarchaeota archaeon]
MEETEVQHAKKEIMRCTRCGRFTFEAECPECGRETTIVRPARFSPKDQYGKYRRIAKKRRQKNQH